MFVSNKNFKLVVDCTPLVSIDLIVRRMGGDILLGYRRNSPAQNYWFVPGGRIRKNESMATAFERLTKNELNIKIPISQASLLGSYEHFYDDSIFDEEISTHYIAIAYRLEVNELLKLPLEQHARYQWFSVGELLSDKFVHDYTKAYFLSKD